MPKKPVEEDEGPSKAWLDSYADAMTLLLAFFILMFAFALVDEQEFLEFKFGVQQALGVAQPVTVQSNSILGEGAGISNNSGMNTLLQPPEEEDEGESDEERNVEETDISGVGEVNYNNIEELQEALEEQLRNAGAVDLFEVLRVPRGLSLALDSRVLFESGSATMSDDGVFVLGEAAEILTQIDNLIEVQGHTDNEPTRSGTWPTNWELSTTRATTVLRVLNEVHRVPATRLAATGFADTRPRASNTTEDGRQENRRVELLIVIDSDSVETGTPIGDDPTASEFAIPISPTEAVFGGGGTNPGVGEFDPDTGGVTAAPTDDLDELDELEPGPEE